MKIQNKIFLMIVSIIIPAFLLLIFIIPAGIEKNLINDILLKMEKYQGLSDVFISQNLNNNSGDRTIKNAQKITDELSDMFALRVSLYNQERMLADSGNFYDEITPEVKQALTGKTAYRKEKNFIYYAFPVNREGAVRLQYPLETVNKILSRTVIWLLVVILIILVICIVVAGLIARKISEPIKKLNLETAKIKEGNYDLTIEPQTDDEIGQLTSSFIEMSAQIKEKIKQLKEMLKREKELKNMQQDFLNSVTHEFKTPLTSIIGYSDLLKQYQDDPDLLNEAASTIRKESQRLYKLVEKVISLSRMEKYNFEPEVTEFKIENLIDEAIDGVMFKARKKGISIEKDIHYRGILKGDFNLLYRMMINLLDNAVKYNRENGEIKVVVEKNIDLIIKISDTGIGISREDLDNIFVPFYREDKMRSRKIGGDGLGLSIVKEIIEKHEGQINIESEKGKGTTVEIKLPLNENI